MILTLKRRENVLASQDDKISKAVVGVLAALNGLSSLTSTA